MASRALVLSLSFLALAAAASAQEAIKTNPSDMPTEAYPGGTGGMAAPIGPLEPPPVPLPSEIGSAPPSNIESGELNQLDGWSVSALSRGQGGLPDNLWAGTDGTALASLLQRLPANYASPAAQALALRVVLSGGSAPSGDTQEAMRKRFEALGKAGLADALSTLAAGAGPAAADPAVAQYAAQAELARGSRAGACARGRAAETNEPSTFLMRLRAYCAAATGDRAAADLALELARSGPAADQAWYSSAIAAIAGAPAPRSLMARYGSSLDAAISLAANLRAPANPIANSSNLALLAIARADNAPQPARAQATALAFRRGLLSPAEARTILRATPATQTANVPAILTALRQVEAAPGSLAAATAIAGVLRQGASPADFSAAARFFKDDIAGLQTAPNTGAALDFARAALAAGDVQLASRLSLAASQAGVAPGARAPFEAALAVARQENPQTLGIAAGRRIDTAAGPARAGAARDAMILAAMGASLDSNAQTFLQSNPATGGAPANAEALSALISAAQRGSVGEAGIAAALAAGEGPARLSAESLAQILRALRQAGLDDHARSFAVEALLAGPPGAPAAPRAAAAAPTPATTATR